MLGDARRGGVLVEVGGARAFFPASIAVKVAPVPTIARLAGGPPELLGIALFEGALIPVVTLVTDENAAASPAMLVCVYGSEQVGLVGLRVIGTGMFDADPSTHDGIVDDGAVLLPFDVEALHARVRGAPWSYTQRPA